MLKQLKNSSILLTTHRMDEAESLCDKIAIMINGKFVCYGSPGHLKQKYGQGYEIIVRPITLQNIEFLDRAIQERLPFAKRELQIDQQANNNNSLVEIIYKIEGRHHEEEQDPARRLSNMFYVMNSLVEQGMIMDFSVTRSSLEHVFIHFAKFQLGAGAVPKVGGQPNA